MIAESHVTLFALLCFGWKHPISIQNTADLGWPDLLLYPRNQLLTLIELARVLPK